MARNAQHQPGRDVGIARVAVVRQAFADSNRDYVEFFVKDPTGNQMAGVAIFFQLVGYIIMKKIVSIEV